MSEGRAVRFVTIMTDKTDRATVEARLLGAIKEAIALNASGEAGRAVQLLLPLLAEFPEEPAVQLYTAWYLRRCGRFEEAMECARHAVEMSPTSSKASLVLFHTLWAAGSRRDAVGEIRRFLPIRPTETYTSHNSEVLKCWEARERATQLKCRKLRIRSSERHEGSKEDGKS